MGELPLWIVYGAWIGAAFIAGSGVLAVLVRALVLRRARGRSIAAQRGALGEPCARVDAALEGQVVVLEGTLRSISAARLRRPDEASPVLAIATVCPAPAQPPWLAECEHAVAIGGLELWLDGGERVMLSSERLELAGGSIEGERGRAASSLPASVLARWRELPLPHAAGSIAFRSLAEGDRVVARGRLKPAQSVGDYRQTARVFSLAPISEDGALVLAYRGVPALRWRRLGAVMWTALLGAALGAGLLGGAEHVLAGVRSQRGDDEVHEIATSSGPARVRRPFGAPPLSFLPGALSPFQRERALFELTTRYREVAPADEAHVRTAIALRALDSCASAARLAYDRGRYEIALSLARGCPHTGDLAFRAARALGRLDLAARLPTDDELAKLEVLIAIRRWGQAAEVLRAREQRMERRHGWRHRYARLRCMRVAVAARAGEDVEPVDPWRDDGLCRLVLSEIAPAEDTDVHAARRAMNDDEPLAMLLSLEGGEDVISSGGRISNVFTARAAAIEYDGLWESARRTCERAPDAHHEACAFVLGRAATFEHVTGDPARAEGLAREALQRLSLVHEHDSWRRYVDPREAPLSVLAAAALERGEPIDEHLSLLAVHGTLPSWVELITGGTVVSGDRSWSDRADRSVIAGDGHRVAMLAAIGERSSYLPALVPLVRTDRALLAEHLAWSSTGREAGEGLDAPRRLLYWSNAERVARILGDADEARRARAARDRFRRLVLRRDTALLLRLASRL